MSGTIAAALKAKLFGASNVLTGLSGMTGVEVHYDPPPDIQREQVIPGDIGGPIELIAMRGGGSNRLKRQQMLELDMFIEVRKLGERTRQASDTRACAISALIENYIAANPRLDGSIADLKQIKVSSNVLRGFRDDDGTTSSVHLTLTALTVMS